MKKRIACLVLSLLLLCSVTSIFTSCGKDSNYVKMTVEGYGDIVIELYPDIAPLTVANFKKLVSDGFYDGLTFHRIRKGFMIQGGDPDGDGTGGSKDTVKGEFAMNGVYTNTLSHTRGVISMARGTDMNSASSQFFICDSADYTTSLDGRYAAFGKVIAGLDVVDAIAATPVVANAYTGEVSVPVTPPVISSVRLIDKTEAESLLAQ